jgi:hypothetical protein
VDVSLWVVIVADALAGAVTVVGLTEQTGGSTRLWLVEVTTQLRVTVPVKSSTDPTVMIEDAVPPGATASGEKDAACKLKFCAAAAAGRITITRAAHSHRAATPACPVRSTDFTELNLGVRNCGRNFARTFVRNVDGLELSMCRFRFK